MKSTIFGVTENDVQWCFPEFEHDLIPDLSQEQLDKIAERARELMDAELNEWFWNVFDDCLTQAVKENVVLNEEKVELLD